MSTFLFYFFLSIALLSEGSGIGISLGRHISYYTLLMSPLILFCIDWYQKRPVAIPKWINFMFLGFLGANIISTFFSWYPRISFEFLLWYISAYLFFVYAYNHKEEIQRYIIQFIFAFSFFFIAYSVFLQFFGKGKLFFISLYGFNFVYSLPMESISHNHLGDFLVLPLLYCFYQVIHKKGSVLYALCSMLFLPFFFLSYSRSAYLSLAVGMVVTIVTKFKSPHFVPPKAGTSRGKQKTKVENIRTSGVKWLLLIFFLFLFFFSFVIVGDKKQIKPIANIRQFLVEKTGLQTKFLTGNRITYALQAFNSMKENFWWGVGPGNYLLISYKYPPYPPYHKSETSHNILIDVFGESGGVGGVFFIMIIILILYYGYGYEARFVNRKSAINSNNEFRNRHTIRASSPLPTNISPILFVFFISMLVNFQFDYTFHIYSFFIFFFVVGGLIYESKNTIASLPHGYIVKNNNKATSDAAGTMRQWNNGSLLPLFLSCSLFFIGIFMLASQYALKNKNYELAIFFYPLNHVAWQKQISKDFISSNRQKGNERFASFEKIARNNHMVLFSIGDMYFRSGQPKKGLEVYKKVVQFNPENKELKDFIAAQQ